MNANASTVTAPRVAVDFDRRFPSDGARADDSAIIALQQLLAREARLLDKGDYPAWLELMADDVIYWMPILPRMQRNQGRRVPPSLRDAAIYKDTLAVLRTRITRLTSGMVWCEDPVNGVRHLVTNIEVYATEQVGEFKVYSTLLLSRSRLDGRRKQFSAAREDLWRRGEDCAWRLTFRKIILDDAVVLDSNLNLFF